MHKQTFFFDFHLSCFFYRPSVDEATTNSGEDFLDDNFQHDLTQLNSDKSDFPNEMAAASKELSDDVQTQIVKPKEKTSATTDSIFTILYSIAKKVSIVGAVYLVGYMNWSIAWLITPIVLAVTREYWHKTNEVKREIAKASATANEKDVILARITDLPAWVCFYWLDFCSKRRCFYHFYPFFGQVYFPDIERCEWVNRVSYLNFYYLRSSQ